MTNEPDDRKITPLGLHLKARQRLEALFERHERGELSHEGFRARVQTLASEFGHAPVLDALIQRLESSPDGGRGICMTAMTALSGHKVVEYLRNQLAEQKGLSIESKTALLAALREMGESIGPEEFGQYLTPADATRGNLKALEGLFRSSFRQSMRDVRQARDAVEAE
ncbi:MAG: hypothetical protein FJ278_25160 [Planctomycetes bacterium]|nr:hypothetical protein [Planctomycetota bacterium]